LKWQNCLKKVNDFIRLYQTKQLIDVLTNKLIERFSAIKNQAGKNEKTNNT